MNSQLPLLLVLAILGLANVMYSLVRVPKRLRAIRRGVFATGTVIGFHRQASESGFPVVKFEAGNRPVEIHGLTYSANYFEVGDEVQVCYQPDNPEAGVLMTPGEIFRAWAGLILGMVLISFATLLVFQA